MAEAVPRPEYLGQERTDNAVTSREEYDHFISEYKKAASNLFGGLGEELATLGPDASVEDVQVFASQKREYVSHLVDRVLAVGRETDRRDFDLDGKDLDNRALLSNIRRDIHPIALINNLLRRCDEHGFFKISDTFKSDQDEILKVVAKRMMEPIFEGAIQVLGEYFEGYTNTSSRRGQYDPHSRCYEVCKIMSGISSFLLRAGLMDLRQCRDFLMLVSRYSKAIDGVILYEAWYQHIQNLMIAEFICKINRQDFKQRKSGRIDDLITECRALLTQLFRDRMQRINSLEDMAAWYEYMDATYQDVCNFTNGSSSYYAKDLLPVLEFRTRRFLKEIDLPGEELVDAWILSEEERRINKYIQKNLELLASMKVRAPGGAKALYTQFGIKNFARLSLDFWLEQYRRRDDHATPYGVLLLPGSDYNGAFSNGHLARLTDNARAQMRGKVLLRAIECKTKLDIPRKLIGLKQRYQVPEGGHQISFMIVAGHGTERSIHMGGPGVPPPPPPWPPIDHPSIRRPSIDLDLLTPEDMSGPGMKRLKTFFRPDAPIILVSCSTGVSGGIGEVISRTYDADLTAPTIPTNVMEWHFTPTSDGRVVIQTEYFPDKKYPDTSTTASYKKGVRLSV